MEGPPNSWLPADHSDVDIGSLLEDDPGSPLNQHLQPAAGQWGLLPGLALPGGSPLQLQLGGGPLQLGSGGPADNVAGFAPAAAPSTAVQSTAPSTAAAVAAGEAMFPPLQHLPDLSLSHAGAAPLSPIISIAEVAADPPAPPESGLPVDPCSSCLALIDDISALHHRLCEVRRADMTRMPLDLVHEAGKLLHEAIFECEKHQPAAAPPGSSSSSQEQPGPGSSTGPCLLERGNDTNCWIIDYTKARDAPAGQKRAANGTRRPRNINWTANTPMLLEPQARQAGRNAAATRSSDSASSSASLYVIKANDSDSRQYGFCLARVAPAAAPWADVETSDPATNRPEAAASNWGWGEVKRITKKHLAEDSPFRGSKAQLSKFALLSQAPPNATVEASGAAAAAAGGEGKRRRWQSAVDA